MENIFRHGDLLIKRIGELPANLTKLKTTVLAEGETTGHKHKLVGQQVQVFKDSNQQMYVELKEPAQLVHEEHKTIDLDAGNYVIIHEREFEPFEQEIRRVAD